MGQGSWRAARTSRKRWLLHRRLPRRQPGRACDDAVGISDARLRPQIGRPLTLTPTHAHTQLSQHRAEARSTMTTRCTPKGDQLAHAGDLKELAGRPGRCAGCPPPPLRRRLLCTRSHTFLCRRLISDREQEQKHALQKVVRCALKRRPIKEFRAHRTYHAEFRFAASSVQTQTQTHTAKQRVSRRALSHSLAKAKACNARRTGASRFRTLDNPCFQRRMRTRTKIGEAMLACNSRRAKENCAR